MTQCRLTIIGHTGLRLVDSKSVFSISYMDKKLGLLSSFEDRRKERKQGRGSSEQGISFLTPWRESGESALSAWGGLWNRKEESVRKHSVPSLEYNDITNDITYFKNTVPKLSSAGQLRWALFLP